MGWTRLICGEEYRVTRLKLTHRNRCSYTILCISCSRQIYTRICENVAHIA